MDLTRFFPPIFFLEADGQVARDIIPYIKHFEFSDEHKKPDEMKLIVINDAFKFISDTRFVAGVTYRVRWGYPSLWSDTLTFKVQKAIPTFPQKDVPLITMISWDSRMDMSKEASTHNYGPVSSSEVARVLARKWGLKTDIEESNDARKQDRVQSARFTDLAYLASLAGALNYRFDVIGDTLVFKPHGYAQQPEFTYVYFSDRQGVIISFTPEIKEKQLRKKLGVSSSDPKSGESGSNRKGGKPPANAIGQRSDGSFILPGGGVAPAGKARVGIGKFSGRDLHEVGSVTAGSPEAKKVAAMQSAAASDKIDLNADKATLKIIGDPRVRKGKVVRVEGVGPFYSGSWYVASTKHVINSQVVYVTEMKLQRAPLNGDSPKKDEKKDKNAKPGDDTNTPHVGIGKFGGRDISQVTGKSGSLVNKPSPLPPAPPPPPPAPQNYSPREGLWDLHSTNSSGASTSLTSATPTTLNAEDASAASAPTLWERWTMRSTGLAGQRLACQRTPLARRWTMRSPSPRQTQARSSLFGWSSGSDRPISPSGRAWQSLHPPRRTLAWSRRPFRARQGW